MEGSHGTRLVEHETHAYHHHPLVDLVKVREDSKVSARAYGPGGARDAEVDLAGVVVPGRVPLVKVGDA